MVFRDRDRIKQRWRVRDLDSRMRSKWGRFVPPSRPEGRVEEEMRPRVVNRMIFSVFLTNFSEEISWQDIKQAGKPFGLIDDVFIPKKRDINNKRFAFIQYKGIVDQETILKGLNGVVLRGRRLIAKRAIAGASTKGKGSLGGVNIDEVKSGGLANNNGDRKSFRNALMNETQDKEDDKQQHLYLVADPVRMPITLQKGTLWGEVNDLETLDDLQNLLIEDGINISKVTYLGGLNVLISFKSDLEAADFMKNICVWECFFKKIKIWDGAQSEEKKIVKINISGLPISLREAANYNKVAALFGRVVGPSDFCWENLTVNGSSVMVLVDNHIRIDNFVTIYWRGGEYVVKVIEDGLGWEPGFVKAVNHYGYETTNDDGDTSLVQEGDEEEDWLISEDEELLHSLSKMYSPPRSNTLAKENGTTSEESEVGFGVAEQERLPENEAVPEMDINAQSDYKQTSPIVTKNHELHSSRKKGVSAKICDYSNEGGLSSAEDKSTDAASNSVEADGNPNQTEVLTDRTEGQNKGYLHMPNVETAVTQEIQKDVEGVDYGPGNKTENSLTGEFFTESGWTEKKNVSIDNKYKNTRRKKVDIGGRRSARIANKSASFAQMKKQSQGDLNYSTRDISRESFNTRDDGVLLGFQVNDCVGKINTVLASERGKCKTS